MIDSEPVRQLWLSLEEASVDQLTGNTERVLAPQVQDALDEVVGLIQRSVGTPAVRVERDEWYRLLTFDREEDCLTMQRRLLDHDERAVKVRNGVRPVRIRVLAVT